MSSESIYLLPENVKLLNSIGITPGVQMRYVGMESMETAACEDYLDDDELHRISGAITEWLDGKGVYICGTNGKYWAERVIERERHILQTFIDLGASTKTRAAAQIAAVKASQEETT